MSKEIKNRLPKLRFPEFREGDDWTMTTLNEISSLITKGTTPTTVGFQFVESGIKFIKIESITEEGQIDLSKVAFITKDCDEALQRSRLYANDILFSIAGALGVVALVKQEILPANTNQALSIIRIKSGYSHKFLVEYLKSPFIEVEISKIKAGAAQPNISLSQVGDFPIFVPDIEEQQKVADCLSSLDNLIAAQIQKLEALKAHKKGLMQQLFPAEGEAVPKLRFVRFKTAGRWEEKTLGSICGNIASGKDKNDIDGEYDLYGSTGIIGKTNDYSYDGNYILVARVGANAGLLTRPNGKFGVTDNTLVVTLRDSENIDFIYYTLEKFGLNKLVFGSGQPLITGWQLKNLVLYFPKPAEQQKIADCLSFLDELIVAQAKKIEALKAHTKGLMQGLFPSINNGSL